MCFGSFAFSVISRELEPYIFFDLHIFTYCIIVVDVRTFIAQCTTCVLYTRLYGEYIYFQRHSFRTSNLVLITIRYKNAHLRPALQPLSFLSSPRRAQYTITFSFPLTGNKSAEFRSLKVYQISVMAKRRYIISFL